MTAIYNNTSRNIATGYQRLSSGKRINSAKDDAAGLAIANKLLTQVIGYDTGTRNTYDMQNLLKTAEGGLETISDNLQRVRELSLQAANGIYTDDDRALIQQEINQSLQAINGAVDTAEFNNQKLLDGTFSQKNTASYPDGSGMEVSIDAMDLAALDLENYDVTVDIDLDKLDSAIASVNSARAKIGAQINRADYTINSNDITMLNLAAAKSRIFDADMAKESMELNKNRILEEYQTMAIKRKQEQEMNKLTMLA